MNKIIDAFTGKKAFIPFITCGDPDLETTKEALREMVKNGASLIELGIPFSDPTAEGPVIQGANLRALKSGTTTDKIFDMVAEIRDEINIPLVFMTYANVVFSYGQDRFFEKCKKNDIAGVILPDLPFEEKKEFKECAASYGIDIISLIAPTSGERTGMIARSAEGFIYLVSSLGVTGTRNTIDTDLRSIIKIIRENSDVPVAVGFGIKTPEQAKEIASFADGVIVGSAVIKILDEYGKSAPKYIGEYVRSMVDAIES